MTTVKEILEENNYIIYSENSEFYKTNAAYRGGDNKTALSVNKETGNWTDFVTQKSGTLKELIKLTSGQDVDFRSSKSSSNNELMKDFMIKFQSEEIPELLPSYSFYNKRGISNETLQTFRSGVCTSGKMNSRYTFPIYSSSGELVGLSGRDLLNSVNRPKWKHLGGVSKFDYPLFINKPIIQSLSQVILLEGISDLLALWECGIKQCVVVFGLNLGKELLANILEINPARIILAFNNDTNKPVNAGESGNIKISNKLKDWFSLEKIEICRPYKNDFGEMEKDEILDWANKYNITLTN